MPASDLEIDLAAELSAEAEPSHQQLTVYVPDRDRDGNEIGDQRRWVLEAAALLARIGGGVTIMPPVEGGWFDPERDHIVWERPVLVYTFVRPDAFEATLAELRSFLHRLGREARQGEVAVEFAGCFYRMREFEAP